MKKTAGSFLPIHLLALLFSTFAAPGQFVAFNCQAPGASTSPNATTWNIFGNPPGGSLKDIHSGAVLPVSVAIATNGAVLAASAGDGPLPGTPLYNAFNGFVDFTGVSGLDALAELSGAATVTYTFNGLNPKTIYSFKAGTGGGIPNGVDPEEWSLFQLSGALAFTSAHTPGAYTNALTVSQVALNTGVNTNGEMVDWENIVPGTNGSFSVSCMQYAGTIPGGATASGPFGYALSAFRLEEVDPNLPRIVSVSSTGTLVRVVFSVPVQPGTATNLSNYSVTNSYGNILLTAATLATDNQTVQLTALGQVPFMPHWLTVDGVVDALTGTNLIARHSTSVYTNIGFTTGYVESDFYTGIAGTNLSALTGNPNFPNHPNRVNYYQNSYWFDSTVGNNYGNRMAGILVPPVSGEYQFLVYSMGTSQFALSTNEDPAFRKVIATMVGGNYTISSPITLSAGQHCYFEALTKEGSSASDFVELGWATPADTNGLELIPPENMGNYLSQANALVRITQQPTNASVNDARSATFTVSAVSTSKTTACTNYQWQVNGVDIPGATSASYTTPPVYETNSGTVYRALVIIPGASQFSSNAVLTVTRDLQPPSVVQVLNLGLNTVELVFSEPIELQSATNLANYAFTNGVPILGAALDASQLTVTLTTARLAYGSNYSLIINGVIDQAFIPNTIPTNTLVQVAVTRPTSDDIGNPAFLSLTTVLSNGVDIAAAGTGIGGTADQFNFNDQLYSGDFDVSVQLTGLKAGDLWAKAGIMARETRDPGARFAATLATPSMNGIFFEYRDPANSASSFTGSLPANLPDNWLRLRRSGNFFIGYGSYDGRTWAQLGSAYITMSNLVYLGVAVSSHDASRPATAQFRDFGLAGPDLVVGSVDNGHETLGPSSRKTPIVISEIMYKPAARADTNNLEFIELYNSNPWFHDLSGYQVTGPSINYTFPAGSVIPGGGFLVIAASPQSLRNVYGITNLLGPYSGTLKKTGPIQLIDEHGAVLLNVPYSNVYPWPVAADGTGHSLVLANPSYGEEDPRAWGISDLMGGSPGELDSFHGTPLRNILINEVLAHSEDANVLDFIELYNHDNQTNDLSGCGLSDDPATNRFTFPPGTTIPPRGFISVDRSQLGFGLKADGETVYFTAPGRTRILDAVQVDAQANGVSFGRWPDGASSFYPLASRTPGTPNSPVLIGDIVINELMYNPISGNDDDQYVELYNKGTNTLSLANWQFASGISFTFPSNTLVAPGGYLVVGRNRANLFAKYPNLNSGNTVGDYTGKLSHGGERVALAMPVVNGTNTMLVVEDEVTYGTGGRWGQWAAGGGSSLELIDPRTNHRLAANWADSDETQKSTWVNIETTGTLDNGQNFDATIDCAQVGLLDVGECLVDDVEVHAGTGGANYALNPGFESGLNNWSLQGCMVRSSLENSGYLSQHSLHIRCSSRIWTGVNSCQVSLSANSLGIGQQATLRFKARWLHGWPEVLMRLHGNWLEAVGAMPVPSNLGTPGAPNSRRVSNAGPAIYEVTHNPPLPGGAQPVVVSARAHDPDAPPSLTLNYRFDPQTNYTSIPMTDDGTGGDAVAGDGVFSATIPSFYSGIVAAFYISAKDSRGSGTRFPALRNDNAPVPECIVRFGDDNPGGSFGAYHLWLTQTNVDRWSNLPNLSNEMHDGTLVNGRRIIYNMQGRFAGSPYHQEFYSPEYSLCHYKWTFPDDDKFLGATSFNKIHAPGNGPGDDSSLQREQTAYTFMRALGVPWLYRRYVALYVNGNRNIQLMEDTQCPDSDMVKEYFPDDSSGYLYKMQPWFEFPAFSSGSYINFNNNAWCTIIPYTTTGGAKKAARYRYNFEVRKTPDSASNFTNVYALVDAASTSPSSQNYVANLESIADMENWMRVFAANHAAGNWDSFGSQNGQNLYGYIGTQNTRYSLMMFDFNIVLGNSGSWAPGQNLFLVNSADGNEAKMLANPTFRRMYLRALQELVNGPLTVSNTAPLIDAKYNAFVANGLNVENTAAIKGWLDSARINIASQIFSTTFSVSPSVVLIGNVAIVSGTAPVNIKTVLVNGIEWPITWKSITSWSVTVPLIPGYNSFSVVGVDMHHQPVPGASASVSVNYTGPVLSPVGQVVINEIMYRPVTPNAQYVELENISTTLTFDLSGWQIPELAYTFPAGSLIGPRKFLVLTANRAAFMGTYGAIPIFDTFSAPMPVGGTLTLVQPGSGPENNVVVAQVQYETGSPWPAAANGLGSSLQLIDPNQDNWRVANWAAHFPPRSLSPGAPNTVLTNLPVFPSLWLNELQADNLTAITNRIGQHVPWLELFNPSTNLVALDGLFLSADYSNLVQWSFPAGALLGPGQFKVVFADGQTNLSTSTEWHAGFQLTSGSGSVALSWLDTNGQPRVLDYVNYTNLGQDHSYGSAPDGQSFKRQEFFYATPGTTNNPHTSLPVAINEWMAGNTHTLRDPVTGKFDDWFELYNYGDSTADLAGYYLSHSLTNVFEFQIPAGYAIAPHAFLLVWADKQAANGTPDLHANFKLSKSGTSIGLFATNGVPVDLVSFAEQTSDISMGRFPDGAGGIFILPNPTPGRANAKPNSIPELSAPGDKFIYLGQALSFTLQGLDDDLPAQTLTYSLAPGAPPNATIDPRTGAFTWNPTATQAPSTNLIRVAVTDNGIPPLSRQQG
ncbi:MAG TPA: lamin tail domain-containing protein, partial [Verrucomicrobiae bacterium]|nr:lamin tail domain-containing protein [Verrucomicrobiae bacterium]